MIPTTQVKFGPIAGDCYRATLASIFEEPLSNFPSELGWARVHGSGAFNAWLAKKGFAMQTYSWPDGVPAQWPGPKGAWHLLGGQSPREGLHATVGLDGNLIFDPHPSRAGLIGTMRDADIFIPLTPEADELIHRPIKKAAPTMTGASSDDPWHQAALAKIAAMDTLIAQGRGDELVPGGGCTEPGGGIIPTMNTARDTAAMLRAQLALHNQYAHAGSDTPPEPPNLQPLARSLSAQWKPLDVHFGYGFGYPGTLTSAQIAHMARQGVPGQWHLIAYTDNSASAALVPAVIGGYVVDVTGVPVPQQAGRAPPTSPPPFGNPHGHIGGSYDYWWWNFGRPAGMPYRPDASAA